MTPENQGRSENVFELNGKTISITDEFLADIRTRWKGKASYIVTSVVLDESDVRWTLDYIALSELMHSDECKQLSVIETRKFDVAFEHQIQPQSIASGLFDYAWDIDVCGEIHTYRVVNEKGSNGFVVYPTKL